MRYKIFVRSRHDILDRGRLNIITYRVLQQVQHLFLCLSRRTGTQEFIFKYAFSCICLLYINYYYYICIPLALIIET